MTPNGVIRCFSVCSVSWLCALVKGEMVKERKEGRKEGRKKERKKEKNKSRGLKVVREKQNSMTDRPIAN